MAIFYLNTIPLFNPPLSLYLSLSGVTYNYSRVKRLFYALSHSVITVSILAISTVYYLLYYYLLFITYIFLKKEFFSTPCKVKERKKIPAGSGVVPYISN